MSKRLAKLEALVQGGSLDPFLHYGLAMEYRSEGRPADALRVFEGLRRSHPEYLPMYLLCGQLLAGEGQIDAARDWLSAGMALATQQGDGKTGRELADALAAL